MTMATKKSRWILLSVFILTAFLLGSVAQVRNLEGEIFQQGDEDGGSSGP